MSELVYPYPKEKKGVELPEDGEEVVHDLTPGWDPEEKPHAGVTSEHRRQAGITNMRKVRPGEEPPPGAVVGAGGRIETSHHKKCFEAWYACDRSFNRAARMLGVAHMGLRRYAEWFDWRKRADERDNKAVAVAEEKSLERSGKMLADHYDAAGLLIEQGMKYLAEYGIDNPKDAIAAVRAGVTLQRQVQGMPDWVAKITNTSDDELVRRAAEIVNALDEAGALSDPGRAEEKEEDSGSGDALDAAFELDDCGEGLLSLPEGSSGLREGGAEWVPLVEAS